MVKNYATLNERKRTDEILAFYAYKSTSSKRERKVILYNHAKKTYKFQRERKVNRICTDDIIAAITAKITAITTQELHRRKQRKEFAEQHMFIGWIPLFEII